MKSVLLSLAFLLTFACSADSQGVFDPGQVVTRKYSSVNNGGAVGVNTTSTDLLAIPLAGTFNARNGDIIIISATARYEKAAGPFAYGLGRSELSIEKNSGTATLFGNQFYSSNIEQPASTDMWLNVSGVFYVSASGTLDFKITGLSEGDTSSISTGFITATMVVQSFN